MVRSRRFRLDRTGAFDPMLGAGAPLRSGGEPDFLFRVLRAGMKVVAVATTNPLDLLRHADRAVGSLEEIGAGDLQALIRTGE